MKTKFIKDFELNDKLTSEQFAIKSIRYGKTADGRNYVNLTVGDKTGEIDAKIWEGDINNCQKVNEGDIVELSAIVSEYKDKQQLKITYLQKVENFDLENFLPTTSKDIDELWSSIKESISQISDLHLKKLVNSFFADKDFALNIKKCPAAQWVHHAYIGGLLEHLSEMLQLSAVVSQNYPRINKDLLITAILLHDIGKTEELNVTHTITRTLSGSLVSHVTQGALMVDKAITKQKDFPEDLRLKILHLILSHHGQLEFGSPVKPMTIEAIALHYLDNLSAKINTAEHFISEFSGADAEFTSEIKFLDNSKLYLK